MDKIDQSHFIYKTHKQYLQSEQEIDTLIKKSNIPNLHIHLPRKSNESMLYLINDGIILIYVLLQHKIKYDEKIIRIAWIKKDNNTLYKKLCKKILTYLINMDVMKDVSIYYLTNSGGIKACKCYLSVFLNDYDCYNGHKIVINRDICDAESYEDMFFLKKTIPSPNYGEKMDNALTAQPDEPPIAISSLFEGGGYYYTTFHHCY